MLALFILTGYGVACLLLRYPSRWLLAGYVGVMVVVFLWLKKYAFLVFFLPPALFEHPVNIIGLSYILFRQIHFLVDVAQGDIAELSLWTYLNYQLNLLTLLAGPIQRYQEFTEDWNACRPRASDHYELLCAYQRILIGLLKVSFIAALCLSYYQVYLDTLDRAAGGSIPMTRLFALKYFGLIFLLYPAYVYFNFSGYCDVVIGSGLLVGQRIPENFNQPYLSRNMIDFWTRQHMTLGFWIRDYLFTPMYKGIAERWPEKAPSLAFLCYFVALFLAGVWHGATLNFVIFGLLHGAGVSAAKLWEMFLTWRYGRSGFKKYLQLQSVRVLAVGLTLSFVCFTFLFFTPDVDRKLRILGAVFFSVTGLS